MKHLLGFGFLLGCVPPSGNELLGDSDRIVDTAMFTDSAVPDTGVNEDTELCETPEPSLEASNVSSQEEEGNSTPDPLLDFDATLNNSILSVNQQLSHNERDVDFSSTIRVEQDGTFIIVHYGIVQDPSQPTIVFYNISYDINVNPSKSVSLDFFMNPVYDIKFKTDEAGLIFELNSSHRWTEDLISMQLEAGDHHLRVYKLGEIIDEQTIRVDEPKKFNYFLKKPISEE